MLDADTIFSAVDAKPKSTLQLARLDNIRGHPRVSLLVDHYEDDWNALWWVRVDGPARVLEEPDPVRDVALEALAVKVRAIPHDSPRGRSHRDRNLHVARVAVALS